MILPGLRKKLGSHRVITLTGPPTARQRWMLNRDPSGIHVLELEPSTMNLDFLLPWADRVRYLTVTDPQIRDVSALASFKGLVELDLWPGPLKKGSLSLDMWPKMQSLAMGGPSAVAISRRHNLQKLMIEGPRPEQLELLASLPHLKSLRLSTVRKLPGRLTGGCLMSLDLAFMRWDSSYGDVQDIETLESLDLTSIKGLTDLSPFSRARRVKILLAEDCPDLASIEGPILADNAKVFLIGNTPARTRHLS